MEENTSQGLQNIRKMYEKLNYFDQYGGSVVLFIIITLVLLLFISYSTIMINAQPIIDDWPNQRCKPSIIPFAGFITHPEGMSATEYTHQNFTYCTQNILSSITGMAIEPLTFVTNSLKQMADGLQTDIQNSRAMFDKVRSMFQQISQEIMGRIMNVVIPLQQIIVSFRDLIAKIQGTMTASLFTLLGSYYTLKSLMGAIAQFIIIILISLAATIAALWAVPFTWGAAMANTVLFVALAIPMAVILAFMVDVLHIQTTMKIPRVKCFDKNTLLTMNDGTRRPISEIKMGDMLTGNNEVTACIRVTTEGSVMYNLDGILVSDSHLVKTKLQDSNNNDAIWLPVSKHPNAIAISCDEYKEPYLYCLNTSSKMIVINQHTFTDWDEIYRENEPFNETTHLQVIQTISSNVTTKRPDMCIHNCNDLHTFLDGGFAGSTKIKLADGRYIPIKEVQINDILEGGEKVYGCVTIKGTDIKEQRAYSLCLGENIVVGSPNLVICEPFISHSHSSMSLLFISEKSISVPNEDVLYHLLTTTSSFTIGNTQFCDYNSSIDIFLGDCREA